MGEFLLLHIQIIKIDIRCLSKTYDVSKMTYRHTMSQQDIIKKIETRTIYNNKY